MIILSDEKTIFKNKLRDIPKIIITQQPNLFRGAEKAHLIGGLTPKQKLFEKFIDGDIDKRHYQKKYIEYIFDNDELYATLLTILLIYKKQKQIVLACSQEEWEYLYLRFILDYIEDEFNIKNVLPYRDWKKDQKDKYKMDEDKLKKVVGKKKYKKLIFGDDAKKSKDKEKKKSKKKKTKDNKNKTRTVRICRL